MNNKTKLSMGLLTALLTVTASAFTTINRATYVRYYKTDTTYGAANDPRGYQYFSADRCESAGPLCSTVWEIGGHPFPSDGDLLPLNGVTYIGEDYSGHFE